MWSGVGVAHCAKAVQCPSGGWHWGACCALLAFSLETNVSIASPNARGRPELEHRKRICDSGTSAKSCTHGTNSVWATHCHIAGSAASQRSHVILPVQSDCCEPTFAGRMLGPQANHSCHANQGYVAGGRGVVCMLRIPLRANWCAVAHTLLSMCSSTWARLAALQILFFISRDSDGVKIGWPLSRECDGCGPFGCHVHRACELMQCARD